MVKDIVKEMHEAGVATSRGRLHKFITRVLYALSDAQATNLGVELDLLRAIRCRLQLPTTVLCSGRKTRRARKRFDPRIRHRPIVSRQKQPKKEDLKKRRAEKSSPDQLPLQGLAAPNREPSETIIFNNNLNLTELRAVNATAKSKLRRAARSLLPNYHGRVIHLATRKEYTREELVKQFGLTPDEAHSCFLTL